MGEKNVQHILITLTEPMDQSEETNNINYFRMKKLHVNCDIFQW